MRNCLKEKDLIRFAGGAEASAEIGRHLACCDRCATEYRILGEIGRMARATEQVVVAALPRFRTGWKAVLRTARAGTENAGRNRLRFPGSGLVWTARAATAGLVLAVVLVPMLWNGLDDLGGLVTSQPVETGGQPYSIFLEGDDLVIEWTENGDRVHQVARSTSAQDFSHAEVTLVEGNRWIDSDPQQPGMVYYYRID